MSPIGNDEHESGDPAEVAPRWNWGMLLPANSYSRCYRCRRPWWAAQTRTVYYEPLRGQFALCVRCWRHSPLAQRLRAHRWTCAENGTTRLWSQIAAAVTVADDSDGFMSEPEANYLAMLSAGIPDLEGHEERLARVRKQNPDCLVTSDATGGFWLVPRTATASPSRTPSRGSMSCA